MAVIGVSQVPPPYLLKRMVVEVPFVLFAVLMPFLSTGPRTDFLGLTVSEPGLMAAWALLAKGTLGVLASLTLAATTEPHALLAGLERLRLPRQLVQIMSFMVRYLDVVTDEMRRMKVARESRGFTATRGTGRWSPAAPARCSSGPTNGGAGAPRDAVPRLHRGLDKLDQPGRPMSTPVLDVRGLAAYPDGHQALYGVDLHVHAGERVAPAPTAPGRPPSCCTSTGSCTPAPGPSRSPAFRRPRRTSPSTARGRSCSRTPTTSCFMGSVRDDVAFGPANLGLRGAALEARVMDALDKVGMADFADRPPHHLSFGQRRRVAVATVLAMEPEILVLDEPSSNLDPASRRELADILRALDVTVLMVTHDLPYAFELCPVPVVLSDGVVVADGPTYDVLTDDALMTAHRLECRSASTPGWSRVPEAFGPGDGVRAVRASRCEARARARELLLFVTSTLLLLGGGVAWLLDPAGPADFWWTAGTALGLVASVAWTVAAVRRRRPSVDVIAVLALAGALAVGEAFAGAMITVMLASGRLLEALGRGARPA